LFKDETSKYLIHYEDEEYMEPFNSRGNENAPDRELYVVNLSERLAAVSVLQLLKSKCANTVKNITYFIYIIVTSSVCC
jgi:hypothetical protein